MTWRNDADKRRRDAEHYRAPEYVRNRAVVLRRAAGRCEQCGRRAPLQVDHRTPLSQGGGHDLANLWALCSGPGGSCHATKSGREGRQARRQQPRDPVFTRPNTRF